jgi:methylthioribose-1-phosphate isomerase
MQVAGRQTRTIWVAHGGPEAGWAVEIIDQRRLPHAFEVLQLRTVEEAAAAIKDMAVRGAPLIGATAAYGLCLAARADASDEGLARAYRLLHETRPTAVNLRWALDETLRAIQAAPSGSATARITAGYARAAALCDEDVAMCRAIGEHGVPLIETFVTAKPSDAPINVLTHCNAGWLATVDHGTALAPIYAAQARGIKLHVWVDETRPRNQGASLTAWELGQAGVPHTVVVDNAGGHLMQRGLVDLVIVGSDRTTARGDVCNKIGTYLKALAAREHGIPFYVALPSSSIDFGLEDGVKEIPIEERDEREVVEVIGRGRDGQLAAVRIVPEGTRAANPGFDVTPASFVSALVTERGVCPATREGLQALFPEKISGSSTQRTS